MDGLGAPADTAHGVPAGWASPGRHAVAWGLPLWRWSWLYQCTKVAAHWRAASRSAKPLVGNSGRYLAVRNNDSTSALSSLTRGREYEGLMPSQCSIAGTVVALNEAPLSLSGTGRCSGARSAICSVRAVRRAGAYRPRPAVAYLQAIGRPPALQGTHIDPRRGTGGVAAAHQRARLARCPPPGFVYLPGRSCVLALAEDRLELFDSTSSAAVSASAFSLRCSSRSSSRIRRRSCLSSRPPPLCSPVSARLCWAHATPADTPRCCGTRRCAWPRPCLRWSVPHRIARPPSTPAQVQARPTLGSASAPAWLLTPQSPATVHWPTHSPAATTVPPPCP